MNEFNVLDFGAVADGVTDCTKALQRALDAAAECRGTVVVPSGDYLTGSLKMGPGVSLRGIPAWSYRNYGSSVLHLREENDGCLLDMTGAFGGSVYGICLDGGKIGHGVHGIRIDWQEYNAGGQEDAPTFDDCRIGHFSGDGIHLNHIWCFTVRHCMLCFNDGCGLYIDGWDAFILDNWISGNGNCGIRGGACVASITATGNRVEWNGGAGFRLGCGDSYNITGNFFDRSGGPALDLGGDVKGCSTVTVTGNIFRRSGKPCDRLTDPLESTHIRMRNCSNVTVTGNAFALGQDDGNVGEFSPRHSFVLADNRYCLIRENVLHNGQLEEAFVTCGDQDDCITDSNVL